uniref:Ig-like domain-containing protein n=1 Tax=Denticeps clupeoides TaxID=299321 RepID=A0AAY3ZVY6_9TELE
HCPLLMFYFVETALQQNNVCFLLTYIHVFSRTARSEEDRDTLWDAWGSWSECSRTCGGGASYSLRRCLSSKSCEGQNIKYRTCSNLDCPPDSGDFRAQQCSAHADVHYQGQYYEWLPVDNDPENPCALKCKAKGTGLVVELAPKVLDGTRCYTESLDMCISGACQIVGCDLQLGSTAKEDNCGICNGDGTSCRLVRGHFKTQHSTGKTEDTVIVIPYGSRHVRLILKGLDHLFLETKTLQGMKGELSLDASQQYHLENTTVEYQKLPDKEVLRITGPLGADFSVKVRNCPGADSVVQFIFYQPIIHRWKETDFYPCSVTCGGGYQLTSAECFDLRTYRVVVDQYCHYYPENIKPKPKLQECFSVTKQLIFELKHVFIVLWESSPWTACSTSCDGGVQSRSVSCVEEDMQGTITPTEEWKCLYAPKTPILQPCNNFDCPTWLAQEWSQCTVTCGQGLRYRVVLCVDHRGLHAGGCNPTSKPHIKEDCLAAVPCYKPMEKLPVEAKPPWFRQAQELEAETTISEEPTFIPGPWGSCSRSCGAGTQWRTVKCQVLLPFSQTVADLPDDECEGPRPLESQPCYQTPCPGWKPGEERERDRARTPEKEVLHDWEYEGFTECSETCGGGMQEAVVICLNKQTQEVSDEGLCERTRRPPELVQACNIEPCPPRWDTGPWSSCSAICGVGLRTRAVKCILRLHHSNNTQMVQDEECNLPKPSLVQACNRFDCPPSWYPREWGQCSRSCGGGTKKREVLCKQRMADGSVLELPDTFCPTSSPPTLQPCGQTDCPPQWVPTDWSECSATCGEGTQRLLVVCQRLNKNGQYETLMPDACDSSPRPGTVRVCLLLPCKSKSLTVNPEPTILAQKKVYIQWRKGRKLHFVVGGYAYLLPWTSVVIRCPTRRFRKGHIRWLKDGKALVSLPHLTISHLGYIKIQQLRASDAGVYTCVAGQAQENFVLRFIGSKRKLAVPEGDLWLSESDKKVHGASFSTTQLHFTPDQYDMVVQRILDMKDLSPSSKELLESSEKNGSNVEDETAIILVADMETLDEVSRNLSGGQQKENFLAQLLGELTQNHEEANESTFHVQEIMEVSTQSVVTQKTDLRTAPHSTKPLDGAFRSPVIIQKDQWSNSASPLEFMVNVGNQVMLPRQVIRLVFKCQSSGKPEPVITWTKDGKELQYNSRWVVSPWSACSVSCGGGLQRRTVTCQGAEDGDHKCAVAGKRPSHLQPCSIQSCAEWMTPSWGPVIGCVCVTLNRPSSRRNCTTDACALHWLIGPWTQCTATCGRHGFQSRHVTCAHRHNRKPIREIHCSWRPRPTSWRRCNIRSCGKGTVCDSELQTT